MSDIFLHTIFFASFYFSAEWDEPKAGMFIWMKLNGIEDTQSLIEEKARDANGNYPQIFCKNPRLVGKSPSQAKCPIYKIKLFFSFIGTRNLFFNCIRSKSICSRSIFIAK